VKKEISPAVVGVVLVVVVVLVIGIGYKVLAGPGGKMDTTGSEKDIERVKKGEAFYQPPANAPVPKAGGDAAGGGSGQSTLGGYNLHPPDH
jgi:hypothetical protein